MASLNELTHLVGHPLLGDGTPYFVNILVRGAPRWDTDRLSADLRAEFRQVRASHFDGALVLSVDGSPPFAIARGELPPPETFDQALRDTVWPDARSAVARAKHAVSVMDSPGSAPRERLDRFQRIVRVLLRRHVDAVAIHWTPSECIVDPVAFAKNEPHVLMQGAVNVRLFRGVDEAGERVALHMDTLGLGAFGLPDLECRFLDLDPNQVGERLYLYAEYLIDKGDVLANGNTVDGLDGRWACRRSVARAGPARSVVVFDPGIAQQPVLRIRRVHCPACGVHPDANARWECHCGFWWNTFDTAAVCPACSYEHVATQCHGCKVSSEHKDWYA